MKLLVVVLALAHVAHGQWWTTNSGCGQSGRALPCAGAKLEGGVKGGPIVPFIVGGVNALSNEITWQVALTRASSTTAARSTQVFCGGTILNRRWIITAAHCMTATVTTSNLKPCVGRLSVGDSSQDCYSTSRIVKHASYNSNTMENDIALVETTANMNTGNSAVNPACSPTTASYTGNSACCSGWGTTSSGGSQPSNLLVVNIPVISNTECSNKYAGRGTIYSSNICTYQVGKDACQGDSGGPLVVFSSGRAQLVGAVSWGIGCAAVNNPGVYCRVSSYLSWITANAGSTPH